MAAPITRVEVVQNALDNLLSTARPAAQRLAATAPLRPGSGLTVQHALEIYEDQVTSRLLDVTARELKRRNEGFYTISSAGHENNAIVGALLRLDDPCFLHYRSGGLMMARSRKSSEVDGVFDTLLSFCASKEDPISQGRHKVWGSRPLWVPPQTSTIASHLPKASGFAFALRQARRLGKCQDLSDDSIVCCSFGDASANHATALSGINAARCARHERHQREWLFPNDVRIEDPAVFKAGVFRLAREADNALHGNIRLEGDGELHGSLPDAMKAASSIQWRAIGGRSAGQSRDCD